MESKVGCARVLTEKTTVRRDHLVVSSCAHSAQLTCICDSAECMAAVVSAEGWARAAGEICLVVSGILAAPAARPLQALSRHSLAIQPFSTHRRLRGPPSMDHEDRLGRLLRTHSGSLLPHHQLPLPPRPSLQAGPGCAWPSCCSLWEGPLQTPPLVSSHDISFIVPPCVRCRIDRC